MARFELSDEDRSTIVSGVPCAVLLERHGYALDRRESTRNCLKYRAGKGDTIIVNHEGRGWWDTGSDKKGDVFDLIRRLEPDLGWRDACAELGRLVGVERRRRRLCSAARGRERSGRRAVAPLGSLRGTGFGEPGVDIPDCPARTSRMGGSSGRGCRRHPGRASCCLVLSS